MGRCSCHHKDTLTDACLYEFHQVLEDSGRERPAFYSVPRMSGAEFVDYVRSADDPWWLLTLDGEAAGMIYLTDIKGKSAMCHFCFLPMPLRHSPKLPAPVALGRFGLACILHSTYQDGTYILNTLTGTTPIWNKAAVKTVLRCGAVSVGEIPSVCHSHDSGASLPGLVTYYTRETVPAAWLEL